MRLTEVVYASPFTWQTAFSLLKVSPPPLTDDLNAETFFHEFPGTSRKMFPDLQNPYSDAFATPSSIFLI